MMNMQEKIDYGIELYRESRRIDAELSKIKAAVREHALKMRVNDEPMVELAGEHGTIEVTFPVDDYRVAAKHVELVVNLRGELGDAFEDIFDSIMSYKVKSEFMEVVNELPDKKKVAVLEAITVSTPTPRVTFPK